MRFLIFLLLSTACFADLKVEIDEKARNTVVVSGLVNAVVSPDGTVSSDETSKPVISAKSQKNLRVITDLQFVDLTIERLDVVDGKVKRQRPSIFKASLASPFEYVIEGDGEYDVFVTAYGPGVEKTETTIQLSKPKPPPKPDDPVKPEVKSFRVIWVRESGQLLPKDQMVIPGAKSIRDYLSQRTTPENGTAGWREYDPQQNIANEQSAMKGLWTAAKSSITKVPSVVIEVNGAVKILDYPANITEALKLLKEYGGQ